MKRDILRVDHLVPEMLTEAGIEPDLVVVHTLSLLNRAKYSRRKVPLLPSPDVLWCGVKHTKTHPSSVIMLMCSAIREASSQAVLYSNFMESRG